MGTRQLRPDSGQKSIDVLAPDRITHYESGPPKCGKTTRLVQWANKRAAEGFVVTVFSCELSEATLRQKRGSRPALDARVTVFFDLRCTEHAEALKRPVRGEVK